jgi:hypothetical protein
MPIEQPLIADVARGKTRVLFEAELVRLAYAQTVGIRVKSATNLYHVPLFTQYDLIVEG